MLLKPEYVVPEFLMHIRMMPDDAAEHLTDNGEKGPGLITHTTGGSSKHLSNTSSRKIPISKITLPSTLTLAPRSYYSGYENDGDGISGRKSIRIRDSGSGSLCGENDGIGKLLMTNKICKEEREISEKDVPKSVNGRGYSGHSGSGPGSLVKEMGGFDESVLAVSEEEEGRYMHSAEYFHAMKKKQSILSSLYSAQQDWRCERRRIVEGVCSHLTESQHTSLLRKDLTNIPDRNAG